MSKPITITVTGNAEMALPLPPRLRRQAGIKAGDQMEVRVSGGIVTFIPKLPAADEYTPEERRAIDAELTESLKDVSEGRIYGPFETMEEVERSFRETGKQMRGKTKTKRSPSTR